MKKVLITGNLGYVGPAVTSLLKSHFSDVTTLGVDTEFFAQQASLPSAYEAQQVDQQIVCDIRDLSPSHLQGVDVIIHLAAISNDPMGNRFEDVTYDINVAASQRLAMLAKSAGVKRFVFASSCSVYGAADTSQFVDEHGQLNPVTAYAKSKIELESALQPLADSHFDVYCLRFATACGASCNLRLDLVLNDFVYSAVKNNKINILSDGTPWRPLIDTYDMARALVWAACVAERDESVNIFNVGKTTNNYNVLGLAEAVQSLLTSVEVEVNTQASSDTRSYRVDFTKFEQAAMEWAPKIELHESIRQLIDCVSPIPMGQLERYKRLFVLDKHLAEGKLNTQLKWQ